jgi:hypothetical protein
LPQINKQPLTTNTHPITYQPSPTCYKEEWTPAAITSLRSHPHSHYNIAKRICSAIATDTNFAPGNSNSPAMLCTKVTSAPRCLGEHANPIPIFPVEALPIKRTGSKQTISSAVRLGLDAADACELLAYYRIFRGE